MMFNPVLDAELRGSFEECRREKLIAAAPSSDEGALANGSAVAGPQVEEPPICI